MHVSRRWLLDRLLLLLLLFGLLLFLLLLLFLIAALLEISLLVLLIHLTRLFGLFLLGFLVFGGLYLFQLFKLCLARLRLSLIGEGDKETERLDLLVHTGQVLNVVKPAEGIGQSKLLKVHHVPES